MKKFLIKLSYTIFPVFLVLLGLVAYVSLYLTPRLAGDLGRLAYIPFGFEYDTKIDSQSMKDVLFTTVDNTDDLRQVHANVLTVGDSFSQQGKGGYQNYLPGTGLSVVNCNRRLYDSPLQYAYNLLDAGIVDSTKIDVLVVEIGERDLEYRVDHFDTTRVEKPTPPSEEKKSNDWSLLRARDFVMYRFGGRSPVYVVDLDRDLFDSNEPRKLYFYCNDITNGVSINKSVRRKFKEVYDLISEMAKEQGIGFMLLVPVDKYDLYQDYIVNNPYPPKTYNEEIVEIFGETPNILLTKYCLKPLTNRGEKDIFIFTNTHWSYKASEVVGHELARRVKLISENSSCNRQINL